MIFQHDTRQAVHADAPRTGSRRPPAIALGVAAMMAVLFSGCVEIVPADDGDAASRDLEPADRPGRDAAEETGAPDGGLPDVADGGGELGPGDVAGVDPEADGPGPDAPGPDVPDTDGSDPEDAAGDGTPGEPDAIGCVGGCAVAPNDCYDAPGTCEGGECVFAFRGVDATCDDDDPCTLDDRCDALGACAGLAVDCERAHSEGGTCVGGACQGWTCVGLWGDCNDDMDFDGCETPLDTATNCGLCRVPCSVGAHADASCTTGECLRTCRSPWENCDGGWANGCEIPTGVPNQCDADGLNPSDGCWTAWCGSLNDPDARNFGTWYCYECSTCHQPAGGRCQWCDHSTGLWFPDDACACGGYLDLVCE